MTNRTLERHRNEVKQPTPQKVMVGPDPEVQEKYNKLGARLGELRTQKKAANGEINTILASLGAQVAEGEGYQKSTARLSELRSQSEALQAGILFVDGQRALLERLNTWLRSR